MHCLRRLGVVVQLYVATNANSLSLTPTHFILMTIIYYGYTFVGIFNIDMNICDEVPPLFPVTVPPFVQPAPGNLLYTTPV